MGRVRPWHKPKAKTGFKSNKGTIYATNRWHTISRNWRNNNPVCNTEGCNTICLNRQGVTDHIIPIRLNGARYDKRNFQSLCHSCHNAKSRREQAYGILYETIETDKERLIPKRDSDGNLIKSNR